jgi:hypothetical protein
MITKLYIHARTGYYNYSTTLNKKLKYVQMKTKNSDKNNAISSYIGLFKNSHTLNVL